MKLPLIEPLEQRIAPANVSAISVSDVSVTPGTSGSSTVHFFLTLDQPVPAGEEVIVHYSTKDGTAISNGVAPDFTAQADTQVIFMPGDTTKSVGVQVNGRGLYGPDERFTLEVASATLDDSQGNPINDGQGHPINLTLTIRRNKRITGRRDRIDKLWPYAAEPGDSSQLHKFRRARRHNSRSYFPPRRITM